MFSRLLTRNKSNSVDINDVLKQYKHLTKINVDTADHYFQVNLGGILLEVEFFKKLVTEKDARIKEIVNEKDARIKEIVTEKDARIKEIVTEKDARMKEIVTEKDARIKEKDSFLTEIVSEKDARMKEIVTEKDARMKEIVTEKDARMKEMVTEKDARIKEKDSFLTEIVSEKDARLKEKDCEILASQGLLTSRGVAEAKFKKCLIEMKVLKLAKDSERDNISNIIALLGKHEKNLPVTSKCHQLLEAARSCGCDLKSLYETLCNAIHGAPWHGPSIIIFSKELREEEICLLAFIAEDMSIPYDLQ